MHAYMHTSNHACMDTYLWRCRKDSEREIARRRDAACADPLPDDLGVRLACAGTADLRIAFPSVCVHMHSIIWMLGDADARAPRAARVAHTCHGVAAPNVMALRLGASFIVESGAAHSILWGMCVRV